MQRQYRSWQYSTNNRILNPNLTSRTASGSYLYFPVRKPTHLNATQHITSIQTSQQYATPLTT
jgi:hypothetical protein